MQVTGDSGESGVVTIIIALFVAVLVGHLSLAFWIGWRSRWSQAWKLLIGLSVLTFIIWYIIATAISFYNIMSLRPEAAIEAYGSTFGMLYQGALPFCYETMLLQIALLMLALLPCAFARL